MKKTCSKCGKTKSLKDFYKRRIGKKRYIAWCKECRKEYNKEYRKEYSKSYWEKNKEKFSEGSKQRVKKMRLKDPVRFQEYNSEYHRRPKVVEKRKEYFRIKSLEDSKFNLNSRMKTAVGLALRGKKAGRKWESLVGYTLEDLMSHLESLFLEGMNWNNIGEWHIDHIKPISLFNYINPEDEEFKKCWNLKNLQPLWAEDNLKKGAQVA